MVSSSVAAASPSVSVPSALSFASSFFGSALPFGVDRSEKISCVPFAGVLSCQILNTFSTQAFTLLPVSSASSGFIIRWSKANFRPSDVIFNMLSIRGSIFSFRIFSALSARDCTIAFCASLGSVCIVIYSASGTGSFSMSAVCMSAASFQRLINSGRL